MVQKKFMHRVYRLQIQDKDNLQKDGGNNCFRKGGTVLIGEKDDSWLSCYYEMVITRKSSEKQMLYCKSHICGCCLLSIARKDSWPNIDIKIGQWVFLKDEDNYG